LFEIVVYSFVCLNYQLLICLFVVTIKLFVNLFVCLFQTIKPLSMGGVHGGLKYVVHGILFKFCLASMSQHDLFGSDANAMKTAGNELKV
jgi:hypothetical protein